MDVYISVGLEGVAGVVERAQVDLGHQILLSPPSMARSGRERTKARTSCELKAGLLG